MAYSDKDSRYGNYYSDYSIMGKEETVNLGHIIQLLLKRWYVFLISVPIFVGLGIFILMSTPKTYKTGAELMIENNGIKTLGRGQNFSDGIPFFTLTDNLVDEIAYLKSFTLVNQVVERLDFEIMYFEKETFLNKEHYKNSSFPFEVVLDEAHPQMASIEFFVEIQSESNFKIYIKPVKEFTKYTKGVTIEEDIAAWTELGESFEFEQEAGFGQAIETENFKFTLNYNSGAQAKPGAVYGFAYIPNTFWASYYQGNVGVSKIKDGSVVTLGLKGPVPEKDIDYLNELGQTYIDSRLEQKNAFADGTIEFIVNQLNAAKGKVDSSKLDYMKAVNNAPVVVGDGSEAVSLRLQQGYDRRAEIQKHIRYIEGNLNNINNGGESNYIDPLTAGLNAPNIFTTITNLNELKQELVEAKLKGGKIEQQITQDKIAENERSLKGMLEALLTTKKMDLRSEQATISRLERQIRSSPGATYELNTAAKALEMNQSLYDYLQQQLATAQISKAGTKADAYFLDKARMKSTSPVSPQPTVILAAAFALALILPAAVIILMSFFNTSIRDEEHLKSLTDIPILASIVHEAEPESIKSPDFVLSPLAEAFRYLNINVDYVLNAQNDEKVIGVTSIVKGEGKTFNSVHLGAVMAMSGKRTIIIGADIRRPQLYARLGLKNEIGLTNYLLRRSDLDDIIQETNIQNLYAITSGDRPPNLIELLNSPTLPALVDELKANFDYVIIDTPPVGLVSDYLILAPLMDINLIVTRERYSKIDFIKEVNNMRATEKINRLYFVLNDVKANRGGYAKGKYGARYEYGYGESKKGKKKSKSKSKKNKTTIS
ncbi:MAG: polysaccharide biosynthesis tyrosine autokinase [Bacteroidia bacterium]|nr:polysaccharide biosynthesis tyrosine autokinase [Bacteroidia bacterium]